MQKSSLRGAERRSNPLTGRLRTPKKRDCFRLLLASLGVGVAMTLLWTAAIYAEVYITAPEAIKNLFPDFQEYKQESQIVDGQEFKIFKIFKWDMQLGWAIALDEMGKVKPITFLVGIDGQNTVLGIYILEYRDLFGSDIKRKGFLRQFKNKTLKDVLTVGRDIDAVTGATISSKASASAVKKALKVIEGLKK